MPLLLYEEKDFGGRYARLSPGFYSGRGLVGREARSTTDVEFNNLASSARLDPGYIAALYSGLAGEPGSGGTSRVLIGPAEVSDLGSLGLDNKVSAVRVWSYTELRGPAEGERAILFGQPQRTGQRTVIPRGDWSRARLEGPETRLHGEVQSLCVARQTLAVLYEGKNLEPDSRAHVVEGPACLDDMYRVGLEVNSLKVIPLEPHPAEIQQHTERQARAAARREVRRLAAARREVRRLAAPVIPLQPKVARPPPPPSAETNDRGASGGAGAAKPRSARNTLAAHKSSGAPAVRESAASSSNKNKKSQPPGAGLAGALTLALVGATAAGLGFAAGSKQSGRQNSRRDRRQ
jgi:hypothetical protein